MSIVATLVLGFLVAVFSYGPCPEGNEPAHCLTCLSNTVGLCIRCEVLQRPSIFPVDGVCTSDRAKIFDACMESGMYQDFGTCIHCAPGWFLQGYNNITEADGGCFKCDNVAAGGIANCYTCRQGNVNVTANQIVRAVCETCKPGFKLENGACVADGVQPKCKVGAQKCKVCNSGNSACQTCEDGYGLKGGSCAVCSENCLLCNDNADQCTSCNATILKAGKCVDCSQGANMEGCYTCEPKGTAEHGYCLQTVNGYWVKNDGTTAKCTQTNCVRCTNLLGSEYCVACINDYFNLDGKCVKYYKLSDPNTKGCSDGVVGLCRHCIGPNVFWYQNTCLTLTGDIGSKMCTTIDQDNNKCTACKEGFRETEYGCQTCRVVNCKDCDIDYRYCAACLSGYTPYKKDGKILACYK